MEDLYSLFQGCVYFIVSSTLALSFMLVLLSVFVALIATPIVIFLIFTRKIPFIALWDVFLDRIVPIVEKGFIVAMFVCFFMAAGSYLDEKIGTTVEFSSLSGIAGAIVGVRFLFII